VGNKSVTSKRDHQYQRLDGEACICCRWQGCQDSRKSHDPEPIAGWLLKIEKRGQLVQVRCNCPALWLLFVVGHPSCCVA